MTGTPWAALRAYVPDSPHGRLALAVVAIAVCSLLGRLLSVPILSRYVPGRPETSIVTALLMIVAARAVAGIGAHQQAHGLARAQVLAGLVAMACSWAFTPSPPLWLWPSQVTSVLFVATGCSTWMLASRRIREGQALAFLTLVFTTLVGMGHLFPDADLYKYLPGSGVAIPTVLAFLMLSLGQLLSLADTGMTAALTPPTIAGRMAVRLITGGLTVSLLLSLTMIEAYRRGVLDGETAAMVVSWGAMVTLGSTLWRLAVAVDHAEQAKRRAEEQRNTLRIMMIAALTHDLRSPLQAAFLSAEQLRRLVHDPAAAETLARLQRSHGRVDRLFRTLLDSLTLDSGRELTLHPSALELVELVHEVVTNHEEQLRRRVTVEGAALRGWWDHDALFRVIENLLMNAVKYGRPGSEIRCKIERISGDRAHLAIINQGAPIPRNEWERIFQPFSRAGSSEPVGWGVGLAYARAMVVRHGGSIEVESSTVEGTTFAVRLPRDCRAR